MVDSSPVPLLADEGEGDVQWIVDLLWRYAGLFVLAMALGALGAFIASRLQAPVYEAKTQVLVTRASSPIGGSSDLVQYASLRELTATYSALLKQDWVRKEVSNRIGGEIDKKAIRVSTSTNTLVIDIAVRDPDPARAVKIADTLVQVLIEQNEALQASRYTEAERRLSLQLSQLSTQIDALKRRLEEASPEEQANIRAEMELYQRIYADLLDKRESLRLQKLQAMPNVVQIHPAQASDEPVSPRTLLNTLLGGIVGLALAGGGVFLKETLDNTVRTEEEVKAAGAPVLATLAPAKDLREGHGPFAMQNPRAPYVESLRVLRSNLAFLAVNAPLHSLVVTSPGPGEGKTSIALNLGAVFAQAGKRVVVVDADMRRPRVHQVLGTTNRLGLSVAFRMDVPVVRLCKQWKDTTLYFLSAGPLPPNPAELVASVKMEQILQELKSAFDIVILDTPPGFLADAQTLAARADGVLVVARMGKTNRHHLQEVVAQLRQAGEAWVGVVLLTDHQRRWKRQPYNYYTAYYHAYMPKTAANRELK